MLVLTRGVDESVAIGGSVAVVVLGVRGGRVRLGILAPADTKVNRTEAGKVKVVAAAAAGRLQELCGGEQRDQAAKVAAPAVATAPAAVAV